MLNLHNCTQFLRNLLKFHPNLGGALAILAALFGCIASATAAELNVKIGVAGALSGPAAHIGREVENGVRLAIDDANMRKLSFNGQPIHFSILSEDDAGDPRQANLVAQRLIDAKVVGVVGHLTSGTSIPTSRLYAEAGIPQISASTTSPKFTAQQLKTTFRLTANDTQLATAFGRYARATFKPKSIAVIDDRTTYGQGVADDFTKEMTAAGVKISVREFGSDKTTDWSAILTTVRKHKPDLIFYGGMDATAGTLIRQMRGLGIRAPLLLPDGGCTREIAKLAGGRLSDKDYCAQGGLPIAQLLNGKAFARRYQQHFKEPMQLYAPYAYDAATAMIEAMRLANSSDPKRYTLRLKTLQFSGIAGPIAFDTQGNWKNPAITIHRFQNGMWTPVAVQR